jgi:alkylresorcinol/alkylpyrone synthase
MIPARLLGLGRATAPYDLPQETARDWARVQFAERFPAFERMAPVFTNAGIDHRQIARPVEWYLQPQDWATRTAAYREVARALFIDAARDAIEAAGLTPEAIDIVVTVSSTGIATPSLEALAHAELGLRADVVRVPVFGLGCAGGVSGLALAARLAASQPGARVLIVAVELCSLSFRQDQLTKSNVVATALFGDGAAAAVLCTQGPAQVAIVDAAEHLWPETLDVMGWDVAPNGFGVVFAQSIPTLVARHLRDALDGMCARMGVAQGGIGRFICHPGGARVIDALEASLQLPTGTLVAERDVLTDHGNMSAPTVLFVLRRLLAGDALPDDRPGMMLALGPGFTLSGALLARAA